MNGTYAKKARLWREFDRDTRNKLIEDFSDRQVDMLGQAIQDIKEYSNEEIDKAEKLTRELKKIEDIDERKQRYEDLVEDKTITDNIDYLIGLFLK